MISHVRRLFAFGIVFGFGFVAWALAGSQEPPPAAPGAKPAESKAGQTRAEPSLALTQLDRAARTPSRVILTWADDPARSQAVTWRTGQPLRAAVAEIAVAEGGPLFAAKARRVAAPSAVTKSGELTAHDHSARFEFLQPKTLYAYRVGDGEIWSEWFQFRTAAEQPEPFEFVYFGDAQNDIRSHWSRVIRQAFRTAPEARFLLHAGDLINRANADHEWAEWHAAGGWLNGMVPSIPVTGNHEYSANPLPPDPALKAGEKDPRPVPKFVSDFWRPQFTLPENGPKGLEETVYTLKYQDLLVVVLNSNEQIERQASWLDRVLAEARPTWTVVTFHHPVWSTAKRRDNPLVRSAWLPILNKHRVDLVLQGHDHTYGRFANPIPEPAGETLVYPKQGPTGPVFVVSVSGPKMYDLQRTPRLVRGAEVTQLYQIIRLDGKRLTYRAHAATGELYDAFTLIKQPGQPNELIDESPATPEILRLPPAKGSDSKGSVDKDSAGS